MHYVQGGQETALSLFLLSVIHSNMKNRLAVHNFGTVRIKIFFSGFDEITLETK